MFHAAHRGRSDLPGVNQGDEEQAAVERPTSWRASYGVGTKVVPGRGLSTARTNSTSVQGWLWVSETPVTLSPC